MNYDFYTYGNYAIKENQQLVKGCPVPKQIPIDWNPTSIDHCENKDKTEKEGE